MTIALWPEDLPRPERNTWNASPQDARQERQSEAGPTSFGLRFSSASTLVSLSVLLDADQRAQFDNFFERDTKNGSLLFWMPDPTRDGWPFWTSDGEPLLIAGGPDDGKPLLMAAQWLCSFGKQVPQETIVGVAFRKSFSVVVMP